MFSLIEMIKNLSMFSSKLSKLEETIFNSVRGKLQPSAVELWDKQFRAINKVYRSPDGLEVNLYVMRRGKSDFPRGICFSREDEFKIAVVDVTANVSVTKLRCRVWCVNGHVFSIEYKTSFEKFEANAQGEWQVNCHIENQPVA